MNNQKENVKFRKTQLGVYDVENGATQPGFDIDDDNDKGGLDKNQKALENTVIVVFLVMIWYTTAIFAITSSKMIMIERRLPFLLCVIQFSTASVVTYFVKLFQLRNSNKNTNKYINNPNNKLKSTLNSNTAYSDINPNHQIKTNFSIGKSYYSNTPSQLADMSSPLSLATFPHSSKNKTYFSSLLNMSQFDTYVYQIAISYTLGFIFTNIAFSVAPPSFAETIKSAEPISSVGLAYFFFNEGTTLLTYLTLIPICLGVGISCVDNKAGSDILSLSHHDTMSTDGILSIDHHLSLDTVPLLVLFNWYGFVMAAISNLCFSSRAVISKRLFALSRNSTSGSSNSSSSSNSIHSSNSNNTNNQSSSHQHKIDEVQLFSSISRIGLFILIPVALLVEGFEIYHVFQSPHVTSSLSSLSGSSSDSIDRSVLSNSLINNGIGNNNITYNTNDTPTIDLNSNNIIDINNMHLSEQNDFTSMKYQLIQLFLLNGLAYSTYNLVSFLVLSRTDLVTHAVLNVFRRVFIITFTAWYFQHPLSLINSIGVMIAVVGVLLFAYSKQQRGGGVCSSGSGSINNISISNILNVLRFSRKASNNSSSSISGSKNRNSE